LPFFLVFSLFPWLFRCFSAIIEVLGWISAVRLLGSVDPAVVVPFLSDRVRDRLVPSRSRYSVDRREAWFGWRWVGPRFVPAPPAPSRLALLGDRVLPGWGVCAVFLGRGIAAHRDAGCFGRSVVSVSLAPCRFSVGDRSADLPAGAVVSFDSRDLHSVVVPSGDLRWSVCFWDLPPAPPVPPLLALLS
jgi:hypothetical protein